MISSSSRLGPIVLAGSLLFAACGGGDDTDDAASDVEATSTTVAPDDTAAEDTTTTTAAETTTTEEVTTTAAPEDTEAPEETAPPATLTGPADGVLFTDADGRYSLLIAPGWVDGSGAFPDGIQGWFTGNETADFAENVNIVTNSVPSSTPVDLVVSASVETLEATFTDFVLLDSGVLPGTNHPELGYLEYTAVQNGVTVRFLQTFGLWNDTLVVFTGSTSADGGEAALDALLDYALTLAPPAGS